MVQVVEVLPNKCDILSSNPNTTKKKKDNFLGDPYKVGEQKEYGIKEANLLFHNVFRAAERAARGKTENHPLDQATWRLLMAMARWSLRGQLEAGMRGNKTCRVEAVCGWHFQLA
jgi:hypothetical protein